MNEIDIAKEAMIAAKSAAIWTQISAIGVWVSAGITLLAVIAAFLGVNSWRKQKIIESICLWQVSIINYATGIRFLPNRIHWEKDTEATQEVATLMYDCIKHWTTARTYLRYNKKMDKRFAELFNELWLELGVDLHNKYMNGEVDRSVLVDTATKIYTKKFK